MRYELSDFKWAAISHSYRTNRLRKKRGIATCADHGPVRQLAVNGLVPAKLTFVLRSPSERIAETLHCDRHHGVTGLTGHDPAMGGIGLIPEHLCPACGRPMDLTRTIAASPGYRELRTYGCRDCGVWVTEGSPPGERPGGSFSARK